MPTIAQGSSATIAVTSSTQVGINTAAGVPAYIEAVSGVPGSATRRKLATHNGGFAIYGPFGDGSVAIHAPAGVVVYDDTAPIQSEDARFSVVADASTGVMYANGSPVSGAGNSPGLINQAQALFESQSIGITRPVRSAGRMVAGFGAGLWTSASEGTNHTSTQGYTGFDANGAVTGIRSRTGQAEMLRVVCNNNTATNITLNSPGTNILNAALGGKLMLVVHLESQPGYQAGGTVAGNLSLEVTTSTNVFTNALSIGFNSNQLREGWNFLKFVQRDPQAYQTSSPTTEYHPFGISAACYGNGSAANIVANPVTAIRLVTQNLSGATLTFCSLWTGFDSLAQIILGCDSAGSDLLQYGLPALRQYGWIGYTAIPGRIYTSGSKLLSNWASPNTNAAAMYAAGWENINHTVNHIQNGTLTAPAEIDYEVAGVQALYANSGMQRGAEFYASPQSSSSRLAEAVIRNRGFKLQRHARKWNVCVTPWGIDNPHHVGAIDIGNAGAGGIGSSNGATAPAVAGWQTWTKLKRFVDVLEAYGDTGFPFWHGITTLGDSGSGDDLTGDNLMITKSAFDRFLAYIAEREAAGGLRVRDGCAGFYYGTGR